MQFWRAAAFLVLAWAAGLPAHAHLVPAGQGSIRFVGDSAYVLISLPVSSLSGFDQNGDKLMSLEELNARREDLLRQVSAKISLLDGGEPGKLIFEDLLIPHLHDPAGKPVTSELIAMRRYQWTHPVQQPAIRAQLFAPGTGKGQLLVTALHEGKTEVVVLSEHYEQHRFFAGPLATLGRFVLTGAEHILLGFDHLLFLLTVLVAGAGWRYWAAVVTSFTVAHSVTLTLSTFGLIAVPSSIAEPLIALSIILMALDNLRQRSVGLAWRAGLVFLCGLIHGVGFASALQELGVTGERWLVLLGFNLGVELGQLLFVGAALALMAALPRLWPAATGARQARFASYAAAVLGAILLGQLLLAS